MTKHRRTKRRSQKGGLFGFGEPEDPNAPGFWSKLKNWGSSAADTTKEGVNTLETGLGNLGTQVSDTASSTISNLGEGLSSLNPLGSSSNNGVPPAPTNVVPPAPTNGVPPETTSVSSYGGRHRRHARSMKGGKGGLGLTYYATPVSGLRVAEPTTLQFYANGTNQYSVKGGSRKRKGRKSRKSRKSRRHKRR